MASECLHFCIDDACRLAYSEILPDERQDTATAFFERALAWFARHAVAVERIMTDHGSCYRSHSFRKACAHMTRVVCGPGLPPAHQWHGRTVHPDQPARVGLCAALCQFPVAQRGINRMAGSITIPCGHTPPSATARQPRGCANITCFVRPKGPLLRPDLPSSMTAAAGTSTLVGAGSA
jgi:hypothetical protein